MCRNAPASHEVGAFPVADQRSRPIRRTLTYLILSLSVVLALSACTPQQWLQWQYDHGMRAPNGDEVRQFEPRSRGGLAPLDSPHHATCWRGDGPRLSNPCPAGTTGPLTSAQLAQVRREAQTVAFLWAWRLSEAGRNADADWHARNSGARGTCSETGIFYAESGGNWTARNASSSAAGGFQFLSSTWAGYGGYASAADAPPWVQHERFHQTWANGAGASHWAASTCG